MFIYWMYIYYLYVSYIFMFTYLNYIYGSYAVSVPREPRRRTAENLCTASNFISNHHHKRSYHV